MRKLLLILLISIPLFGKSLGQVLLKMTIHDPKQKPLSGAVIRLMEKSSGDKIEKRTDAAGMAVFEIDNGKLWKVYVNGLDMEREVEVPEEGVSHRSMSLTYNPKYVERKAKQSNDRYNFNWTEQNVSVGQKPADGEGHVEVLVKNRNGIPQKDIEVRLVQPALKRGFVARTDRNGKAHFIAGLGAAYDIDVENVLNSSYIDVGIRYGIIYTAVVEYETPQIHETHYGDTIVQRLLKNEAASGRAYYQITVNKAGQGFAPNEAVYLEEIHGKAVYVAYTDASGKASFLLPIGKKYMVHFNFERDVDVVDLTKSFGFVTGSMELTYRPNPKLEHPEFFIPSKESLFLTTYTEFLKKQYPAPKANNRVGLFVKWGNKFNKNSKEALLEVGYTAQGKGMNMPGNYSFVFDRSGSMAGYYRIEMLKVSFIELVKKLNPEDKISVVIFDDKMEVIFPHQRLGNKKQELISAIEKIEAGGGTNMLEAMKKAYEMVMANYDVNRNNRVILLSDGYDENEPAVLEAVQVPYVSKINCTTVGVGEDYNYPLLKILAEKGRGVLYHIADSNSFREVFLTKLMGEMNPVAYDVKLEVSYNDRLICDEVYGHEPMKGSKNPMKFQLPNLYNGANQVALAIFSVKNPDPELSKIPVIVRIRYRETINGPEKVMEEKIYPEWQEGDGNLKIVVESEQKKLYAMAEMNRAIKVMSDAYTAGDNGRAQEVLEQSIRRIKEIYPNAEDKDVQALMDSMEGYLEAFKNLARKNGIKPKTVK
ncbi:MAG: VWA domain-containing protein [Bacteroidetes bacterium]|nr:VWA domain-containing protein [Bacteroidota bacterium]